MSPAQKISPLELHPFTFRFASPSEPLFPLDTNLPFEPRTDSEHSTIQLDQPVTGSPETPSPKSGVIRLPTIDEQLEAYESRGFLPRGSLQVRNPNKFLSPISPISPDFPVSPTAKGLTRRGAIRIAKPKEKHADVENNETASAVTFEQILCRTESFPTPRDGKNKQKKRFVQALGRAKTAVGKAVRK